MRPTRVVVESRSGGNSIRFFVRQGGVWQEWPRSSVTARHLVDLHWEIRNPLPPPPFGPEGNEWLRAYFADTAQLVVAGDRAFVKHPSGQWFETALGLATTPVDFFSGPTYYGQPLPSPAPTHHRVMKSVGVWWCLGCNAQGTGAPPLHPQPWKEVSA